MAWPGFPIAKALPVGSPFASSNSGPFGAGQKLLANGSMPGAVFTLTNCEPLHAGLLNVEVEVTTLQGRKPWRNCASGTTALLLTLGITPWIVMVLLAQHAPTPSVAQILHAVETKDGRP